MKLRIRGNSIRLRLSQKDVERIKSEGLCEERVEFPSGEVFSYLLSVSKDIETPKAEFADNAIRVEISESEAKTWVETDQVGIYGECGKIKIAVEKDFKCLVPRDEEDEDAFPHPKQGAKSC
ncbi:MAG: hypothetical protein D6687_02335 [Acidobacteria bacterium]|jgi:hypothetical protein|nr:MAG: hypothetical protein D6687_02335 [Acidobacteriota bacterium]GIU81791.1 MAG: hypothetical protein KatS3mg006_0855 [Pyrinomonadaceae bacterium]